MSTELNTLLLIMHGGADRSAFTERLLNLARQLQKPGKKYELIV